MAETPAAVPVYPKIELHVHLEATVRPRLLLAIARRNGVDLPARTVEDLERYFRFTDFDHFIQVWKATTPALQRHHDFAEVAADYGRQAAAMGCVYVEAIFSPSEPVRRGASWQEVFEGYCDGAAEASHRYGVEMRLTPDITRTFPVAIAEEQARWAVRYRDRGVVGLGFGGPEKGYPPQPFRKAFAIARDGGLGCVPHAGEMDGPEAVRTMLDTLEPDRIRHGIAAVRDPGLLAELVDRGVVLDVTPTSNVRTGAVASFDDHPLPLLLDAGVRCSISSDDPAIMDTDLGRECVIAEELGHTPVGMFAAGMDGALCDADTRAAVRAKGSAFDWRSLVSDGPATPGA